MLPEKDFNLKNDGKIDFNSEVVFTSQNLITKKNASDVLFSKHEANLEDMEPLYTTFRGIYHLEEDSLFIENKIRHDLTVINPGIIENEYIKTIGHFNSKKVNVDDTYSEYSQVLCGEALFLLQKNNMSGEVEEITVIEAKKGDLVFIPPDYGQVIINPSEDHLIISSLISINNKENFEPFQLKHGAAYYYLRRENGKGDWVKNSNYKASVGLKMKGANNIEQPIELSNEKSIYYSFIDTPDLFDFLK
jgi:glucose-6-phosphate isomerase